MNDGIAILERQERALWESINAIGMSYLPYRRICQLTDRLYFKVTAISDHLDAYYDAFPDRLKVCRVCDMPKGSGHKMSCPRGR